MSAGVAAARAGTEVDAVPAEDLLVIGDDLSFARVSDCGGKSAAGSAAGLGVSSRTDRGYFIVALSGALSAAVAPGLREYLLWLTHESAGGRLIIDMTAVTDADGHGLTVLIGTRRRASLLGGLLCVAGLSAEVAGMLSQTGLDRRLRIYPSVEAAISSEGSE